MIDLFGRSDVIVSGVRIGARVTWSNARWSLGGRVEELHKSFDNLWGIRALDGHLYWEWGSSFRC